jgi:hypothetical protein
MNKKGSEKLQKLSEFMKVPDISEYAGNKNIYQSISKSFLRQLLIDIKLKLADVNIGVTNSKISFNPGGPAVAGDPELYFITDNKANSGVAVMISDSFSKIKQCIITRTILNMKDYTGGRNEWLNLNYDYNDIIDFIYKKIMSSETERKEA